MQHTIIDICIDLLNRAIAEVTCYFLGYIFTVFLSTAFHRFWILMVRFLYVIFHVNFPVFFRKTITIV